MAGTVRQYLLAVSMKKGEQIVGYRTIKESVTFPKTWTASDL